jgi:proteasome lid subunit RPN8/RPN11
MEEPIPFEEFEEQPRYGRYIIIAISLFMVMLAISLIFFRGPLINIILSRGDANNLVNNTITTDRFNLIFNEQALDTLQKRYLENQEHEFAACIYGTHMNNTYLLTNVSFPTMHEQSFDHVSFERCPADTKALLHSHPFRHCSASETDRLTLATFQAQHPGTIMIIMCELDSFAVLR